MIDQLPPACVVRGLAEARIATAPGLPVTLLSARGAASFAGVLFWRALVRAIHVEKAGADEGRVVVADILDCGAAPGRALEALRLGQRLIVLEDGCVGFANVSARAMSMGAAVLGVRPPALDCGARGASRRIEAWLIGGHDRTGGCR